MSKNAQFNNRAFMHKIIPYRYCYQEAGMIETENGVYTRTYKISPPDETVKGSYHSKMTRMQKENILQKLAENFTFEFTIRNCRMDKWEYLSKVMIPEKGSEDAYHHLRTLYNRVLQENCDIGHNNFTREVYLTLAVESDTPDRALEHFVGAEQWLEEEISDADILRGLVKVRVKGRVELVPVSKDFTVIIDYAHNEVSTRSVLTTLLEYKPKRMICVYGGGGNRSKLRRYGMGEVTGEMADLCVLTCDNPRDEEIADINNDIKIGLSRSNGRYIEIEDRKEAIRYCIENADPGDMIVLLGKGHENYQEVKGIKYRFDEREVIAEIKEELGL